MNQYSDILLKQRDFFATGITRDILFRKLQLKKLYQYLLGNEKKIETALWEDLHKGFFESYAMETGLCKEETSYMIKNLGRLSRKKRVPTPLFHFKAKSYIIPEPYGQTLIIGPWNYPFQLLIVPLAGAIAAGNTVILKPSEISGATEKLIVEMIGELFEPEYISCITGGVKESQELLKLKFDHIFFTGSPKVGKIVMEAAAAHLCPVTLELGGKSPVIVDETASIDLAARRITWGKYLNGGQSCIAPDYLLVHSAVKEKLVERIIYYIEKFYGEDIKNNEDYLRIINVANLKRLQSLLEGETIIYGGDIHEEDRYLSPTITDESAENSALMKEEIFGPILPVISWDDPARVTEYINRKDKPLSMYVFSTEKKRIRYFLQNVPAGNASVNDTMLQYANSHLPFGGVGPSGIGAYHGKHSFYTFSHRKAVLHKSNLVDFPMRYPPYTEGKLKVIRKFLG